MPRVKTQKEFVDEVHARHPEIEVLGTYVNQNTKISVRCRECHEVWSITPRALIDGNGCKYCLYKKARVPEDKFREMLAEAKPTIKLVGGYEMMSRHALFECSVCGFRWHAQANKVLYSTGCPNCYNERRGSKKTHEQFVADIAERHPTIKVLGEYTGSKNPIKVKCEVCGNVWTPRAEQLMQSGGCLNCSRIARRRTDSEFKEELARVNPYVEPIDKYETVDKRIMFKCKKCGSVWKTTPASVLRGSGCSKCNRGQNSFFEHALLATLRSVLGDEQVLSRDRKSIGCELDVFIPSMNVAFEPGAWLYHKNTIDSDYAKLVACQAAGIRLITLYYAVDNDAKVPEWCMSTQSHLSPSNWNDVTKTAEMLLEMIGLSCDEVDWKSVRTFAAKHSGRKSTETFIRQLSTINKDIKVLGEYTCNDEYIEVKCLRCEKQWLAKPHNLLGGKGCPRCAAKRTAEKNTKTHEQFLDDMAKNNPTVKVLGKYSASDEKIFVECRLCGRTWYATPNNLLSGKRCNHCSRLKSREKFLEDMKRLHPTIKVVGEYTKVGNPIKVKCSVCGREWTTTPKNLMSGGGCQDCAWKANGEKLRLTDEEFRARLKERNPDVTPLDPYVKSNASIRAKCNKCGKVWTVLPSNLLRGKGCPDCRHKDAGKKRRIEHDEFVKRLKLKHPELEVIGRFVGFKDKVTVRCSVCGKEKTNSPRYLLSKEGGCHNCR